MLSAGRLMGAHIQISDSDHDLLDENESRVYNNMESDDDRELYLESCFKRKSQLARRSER